jgi:hypothetical protein
MAIVAVLAVLVAIVRQRGLEARPRDIGVHRVAQEGEEARSATGDRVEEREGLVSRLEVGAPGEGELARRHRRRTESPHRTRIARALDQRAAFVLPIGDEPLERDGRGEIAVGGHVDGRRAGGSAPDGRVLDLHAAGRAEPVPHQGRARGHLEGGRAVLDLRAGGRPQQLGRAALERDERRQPERP